MKIDDNIIIGTIEEVEKHIINKYPHAGYWDGMDLHSQLKQIQKSKTDTDLGVFFLEGMCNESNNFTNAKRLSQVRVKIVEN